MAHEIVNDHGRAAEVKVFLLNLEHRFLLKTNGATAELNITICFTNFFPDLES